VPTNAELATALGTADDATLAAIAALNNLSAAQVNAEVDAALVDVNLDHLVKIAVDTDFATTVHLNSVLGYMADNGTSATFDRTTDSLEAIRDKEIDIETDTQDIQTKIGVAGAGLTAIGDARIANLDTTVSSRASQTSVDDVPTNAELAASQASADDATLAAIAALNNISVAQVNAEMDTALADIHLDHLLATTYDPASKPGIADALLNELVESDAGVSRFTANALEQSPSGGGLDAAGVRAAVGLASANLDTQFGDLPTNAELATALGTADDAVLAQVALVKAKTDLIPASPASVGSAMTLTSGERDSIATALLDLANGIESGKTLRQAMRLMAATLAGKRSNAGTPTEQYDAIGNVGTARVVGNLNENGDGTPTLTP
jgi:hypothetical protein